MVGHGLVHQLDDEIYGLTIHRHISNVLPIYIYIYILIYIYINVYLYIYINIYIYQYIIAVHPSH